MKQRNRFILLAIGLFFLTTGITLSIRSGLGTSAVSAIPYVFSETSGWGLGLSNFCFFVVLAMAQMLILGRPDRRVLAQVPFGMLFSLFITLTGKLFDFSLPEVYPLRLAVLLASLVFTALGIYFYMEANLVLNAPEGFQRTVTKWLDKPFHQVKILLDCLFVLCAAGIGLLAEQRVIGVREGTLLSALLVGRFIGWIPAGVKEKARRFCAGPAADRAKGAGAAAD